VDFADSVAEASFRRRLRLWLEEQRPFPAVPLEDEERVAYLRAWQKRLYDAGWMALSFPTEVGGQGLGPIYEAILLDELGSAGAPSQWHYGYVARVIHLYGSVDQQNRFLQPAFRGDERWCQGFSEPNAGSDLSAIATRADRHGDKYVITGQKVWTSEAHWADWCILLARSEPDAPRHQSLSCFILPMGAPGVTVRPFRQITGDVEFAEVFLDEVEISESMRIGDPGKGWQIAMSTVEYERGPADVGFISDLRRILDELEAELAAGDLRDEHELRTRLSWARISVEVLRLRVLTSLSRRARGQAKMGESSVDKLLMTSAEQELAHIAADLHGASMLLGQRPSTLHQYLWSRSASVYGGTSQIQRDIIATRLLGLARSDARADAS
jgi:alkylation response protein AidB-like acyl-CoA dehydrogenase